MPSFSKKPQDGRILEIRNKMDGFVIKHLDLRDKSLGDIVAALHACTSEKNGRFSFILRFPIGAQVASERLSKLILKDVSLPPALNMICEEFEMRWSCEDKIFIYQ